MNDEFNETNDEGGQESALFKDNSKAMILRRDEAAVARATQEIQAALIIGQRFPRDEIKAKTKILEACRRKGLAEVAEYEYSRGGTKILGPTIDLLRAIASRWGNVIFGWAEAERSGGQSSVRCWAWDTQSNARAERTFTVRHWRDTSAGGYALKDERDIYEMLANHASRRVRACLEEVIDSDVVADAVDQCRKTLKEGEKTPLTDRVVAMVGAFREMGVTQGQIEAKLGNKCEAVSENQLASLRRIYKAIKDGVGQPEEYFKTSTEPAKPEFKPAPAAPEPPPEPPVEAPPAPKRETVVKKVRDLCKTAKIKEAELLSFLSEIGSVDGGMASLEQVQLQSGEILKMVLEQWPDISQRVIGARGLREETI